MSLTRQVTIGGHDARVFDGELRLDSVKRLYRELTSERMYSRRESTAERFEVKHWSTELDLAEFAASDVGRRTGELVNRYYEAEGQSLFRAYCNLNSYGDTLSIHRDCAGSDGDITAVWFVCEEWERDWRGELLLFDESYDAQLAVTPKPGRVCLFRGVLPHAGTPPSRLCYRPRLTLTCKFSPPRAEPAAGPGPRVFRDVPAVFAHMERRIASLPPRDFEASYRFDVEGPDGGTWRVELLPSGGRVAMEEGEADVTITLHSETFLDVVNGRTGVARAFFLGKIKARGRIDLATHLRDLIVPPASGA